MKPNMGRADRAIRLAVGLVVIGIGAWLRNWWGAVGLLPIFTAATGWCALYRILGISTRAKQC